MKSLISSSVTILVATSMFAGTVLADPTTNQTSERKQKVEERAIFITGSLIPQRVILQPIGTTTVSPVRIIDRREIDWTGRQTTPGALINDPSLRVIIINHRSAVAEAHLRFGSGKMSFAFNPALSRPTGRPQNDGQSERSDPRTPASNALIPL